MFDVVLLWRAWLGQTAPLTWSGVSEFEASCTRFPGLADVDMEIDRHAFKGSSRQSSDSRLVGFMRLDSLQHPSLFVQAPVLFRVCVCAAGHSLKRLFRDDGSKSLLPPAIKGLR